MKYTIDYNGLTLGNDDFAIREVGGIYGIPIRTSSQDLVGGDGGNIFIQQYSMRSIYIEGIVLSGTKTIDDNTRDLMNAFSKGNESELLFLFRGRSASITAQVINEPIIIESFSQINHRRFRLELLCENPFFNDGVVQEFSVSPLTSSGFPIAFPLAMPLGSTTGGSFIFMNDGDVSAYPSFEISGLVNNPYILNTANGQGIKINHNLVAGTMFIEFTQNGLEVYTSTGINLLDSVVGIMPTVEIGPNTFKFSCDTHTGGVLTARFTSLYKSIIL